MDNVNSKEKIKIYVDVDNNNEKHVLLTVAREYGIRTCYYSRMDAMYNGLYVQISDEDAKKLEMTADREVEYADVHLGKDDSNTPRKPHPFEILERSINKEIYLFEYEDEKGKSYFISRTSQEILTKIGIEVGIRNFHNERTVPKGGQILNWCKISEEDVAKIRAVLPIYDKDTNSDELKRIGNVNYKVVRKPLEMNPEDERLRGQKPEPETNEDLENYKRLLEEYRRLCQEWQKMYEELKNARLKYKRKEITIEEYIKIIEIFIVQNTDLKNRYNVLINQINIYGGSTSNGWEYPQEPMYIILEGNDISDELLKYYIELLEEYRKLYEQCQKDRERLAELEKDYKELKISLEEYQKQIEELKKRIAELEAQYKLLMSLYNLYDSKIKGLQIPQQPITINITNVNGKDDENDKSKFLATYLKLLREYKLLYEECKKDYERLQQLLIECEKGKISLEEYTEFAENLREKAADMRAQYNMLMIFYNLYIFEMKDIEIPQKPFSIHFKNPKNKGNSNELLETYLQLLADYKKAFIEYEKEYKKFEQVTEDYKENKISYKEYFEFASHIQRKDWEMAASYNWLMNLYNRLIDKFKDLEAPQKPFNTTILPPKGKDNENDHDGMVRVDFLNNGFAIENYSDLWIPKGTIIHPPVIPPEPVNDKNQKKRITFKTFDCWRDQYGREVDFSKPIEEDLQISASYKFDKLKALALGAGAAVGVLAYLADAAIMAAASISIPVIAIGGAIGFGIAAIASGRQLSRLIEGNRLVAADVGPMDEIPEGLEESVKKEKKDGFWNKFFRNSAIACGIAALIHIIKPPKIKKPPFEPDPKDLDPPPYKQPIYDDPGTIKPGPRIPRMGQDQIPGVGQNQIPGIDPGTDVVGDFTGNITYHTSYDASSGLNPMKPILEYWKNPTPIEAAYNGKVIKIFSGQSMESVAQQLGANSIDEIGVRIVNGITNENLGWVKGTDIVAKAAAKTIGG